jgi:LemA protein
MPLLILIGLIVLAIIWMTSLYNNLVRLRNRRQNVFADIDVQLRYRHDLVPQLLETVKGYAGHEKDVLYRVTEARAAAISAATINDKIKTEQELTHALQGLKVSMEAYPNLKANENFVKLQQELTEIEGKLATARRLFNGVTTDYNNAVQTFPGNMVARNYGFNPEMFFDLGIESRKVMEEPPAVKF